MAKGKYHEWLTPEGLTRIKGWAMDGLSDEQIAKNMEIRRSTLYEWKKKFTDISDAIKKSKDVADREVENALNKRAKGFKQEVRKVKVTNSGKIIEYTEEVYYPPDTGAAAFWLKNRKPDKWRDRPEINENERDDKKHKEWIAKTSGDKEEGLFDEYEE